VIFDSESSCCRSCGGPVQVIDRDSATLTVACVDCSDTYAVEAQDQTERGSTSDTCALADRDRAEGGGP
jgi:hypothetical protein